MRNIRNFRTFFSASAAIALLTAGAIIVAEGAASEKSTYEQGIEKIMVDYVKAIQYAENSRDKRTAPLIKAARTSRDGAIARAGQVILARFERAVEDSKRLDRTAEAKLAEAEIVEFKKLIEQAQAADPERPETEDEDQAVVDAGPLASHLTFGSHAYLVIMGEHTFGEALARCRRMGGSLVCIESAPELLAIQKELPAKQAFWVGASDVTHEGQWRWLTGAAVGKGCWSKGQPARSKRKKKTRTWTSIYAVVGPNGMSTRGPTAKCKGFVCEWGR